MQHGMIWVGLGLLPQTQKDGAVLNRLGAFGGVAASSVNEAPGPNNPNKDDQLSGEALGQRVAGFATKFKG
jgi:NAD(P)H dehydrogenase (quinone)